MERAEIVREKGTDRSRFFRGQVDRYSWVELGSSYVLSDLLAAVLEVQLRARNSIQARGQLWETYAARLADWAADRNVRLPVVPADCEHPAHLFCPLLPTLTARTAFIEHLGLPTAEPIGDGPPARAGRTSVSRRRRRRRSPRAAAALQRL